MKMATCHPNRLRLAKGLCASCYNGQWRRSLPPNEGRKRLRTYAKAYREKNTARYRAHLRRYKYGMTQEQFDALLEKQHNTCAICKIPFGSEHTYRAKDTPNVDHDHNKNTLRGLLCERCNIGLGGFQDSSEYLKAAIEYLNEYFTM